jgi:hypothetical protein
MEVVDEPSRQSELAIETLKIFEQNGEVLTDERHTIHYFYDGDHVALGDALRELGFTVRPTVDNDGVVAERVDVTDEKWRVETLTALSDLANRFDSEYDGWEAAMMRQGS